MLFDPGKTESSHSSIFTGRWPAIRLNAMAKRTLIVSRHAVSSDAIERCKASADSYQLVISSNLMSNGCKTELCQFDGGANAQGWHRCRMQAEPL